MDRVDRVEDVLRTGQEVWAKVRDVNPDTGKYGLIMKVSYLKYPHTYYFIAVGGCLPMLIYLSIHPSLYPSIDRSDCGSGYW